MARWGTVRTWITSLAIGCGSNGAGDGDATSGASSSSGDPTTTSDEGPDADSPADGADDESSSDDASAITDWGDSTTGEIETGEDTSGGAVCPDPPSEHVLMMAQEGTTTPPMTLSPSIVLPRMVSFARSYEAEAGTIAFELDVPCSDEVIVRALVWDRIAGATPTDNADSLYVRIDDGPELQWSYGCQTATQGDSRWSWLAVADSDELRCSAEPMVFDIEAGEHTVTFRNREAGNGDDFAGIVAVVVTNDANFDPNELYQPYP